MKTKLKTGWYESGAFLWFYDASSGGINDAILIETGVQHSCCGGFSDDIREANDQLKGCTIFNDFEPVSDERLDEVLGL